MHHLVWNMFFGFKWKEIHCEAPVFTFRTLSKSDDDLIKITDYVKNETI